MLFSRLIGNESAQAALIRMSQEKKVPNTLLFYGPDGIGKSLFAIALAELLMGRAHAHKLEHLNHPDLHIYRPEGKTAVHTIETIRALIEEASFPPFEAPVKFFLIHDAHQMLPVSSNALLKTLEEPFPDTYFILLTSSLDALLPTIISRSRKVPFFPIPQSQIQTFIQEKWKKSAEEARRLAFLSHGSLSIAHQLTLQNELPYRKQLIDILSLSLPGEYPQLVKLLKQLEESCSQEEEEESVSSFQNQIDFLFQEILMWYRDLHLLKDGIAPEYLYHLDHIDLLKSALTRPLPLLEKVLEHIGIARLAAQRNVRLSTFFEHFFLSC